MTTISAQAILVSRNVTDPDPNRKLATLLLRYPRCVHAEFLTHRCLSKNSASSRAIPVEKMIQSVIDDPFVPIHWGKNQKGMQAEEEHSAKIKWSGIIGSNIPVTVETSNSEAWLSARDDAVLWAKRFAIASYHKQIINRLLEPWAHITVVCSGTEWTNFFALRDHPDAEPHIQILAREIRKAIDGAIVQELQPGWWHLPFVSKDDCNQAYEWAQLHRPQRDQFEGEKAGIKYHGAGVLYHLESKAQLRMLSVARCASASYKTVEGFDMTMERAVALYDKLLNSRPMHASPFEHQACVDDMGYIFNRSQHRNFVGFRQNRAIIEDELRLVN